MGDTYKVKKRLCAYSELCRCIEAVDEKLVRIMTQMYTVGCPDLSGMPRSPSPSNDMMVNIISMRDSVEENLRELEAERDKEEREILSAVGLLKTEDEKTIIKSRYLDMWSWGNINRNLFGSNSDFADKERAYQAKVYRMHDNALIEISNIWVV